MAHVVAGHGGRPRDCGRIPGDSQVACAADHRGDRRRPRRGPVPVHGEKPRVQVHGVGAVDRVGDPQPPLALGVLSQVTGRAQPEVPVGRAETGIGVSVGVHQRRDRPRRRLQLDPQLADEGGRHQDVDLHVLHELNARVQADRRPDRPQLRDGQGPAGGCRGLGQHLGHPGPALGQGHRGLRVHHPEAVVVVELVAVRVRAVLGRPGQPARVLGVVLAGRTGHDQLHIPPSQQSVRAAHQCGHPRDLRGGRAGPSEVGEVAAQDIGGGDARLDGALRRRAHPQVGSRLGVVGRVAVVVDRADRHHSVVVGELVESRVVTAATVPTRPHVHGAQPPVTLGETRVDRLLPDAGRPVGPAVVPGSPAVVRHRGGVPLPGHGVGLVQQGAVAEQIEAADAGAGGDSSHARRIMLGCDDAGHCGAVIRTVREMRPQPGVVMARVRVETGAQILVVVVDAAVDHRHVHTGAGGGLPNTADVDVLAVCAAAVPDVVQVPLAAIQRVRHSRDVPRAPPDQVPVLPGLRHPDRVPDSVGLALARGPSHRLDP